MSKQKFQDNLGILGLPDRAAFDAMVDLTPEVVPYKEEMLELLESVSSEDLDNFLSDPFPTDLAKAIQKLRTD